MNENPISPATSASEPFTREPTAFFTIAGPASDTALQTKESELVRPSLGRRKALVLYSPSVLGIKCQFVSEFSHGLFQLVADLFETMYGANGVGLAAPQIGAFLQVAVIHCMNKEDGVEFKLVMVNPKIVEATGIEIDIESCLSLPGRGVKAKVKRAQHIKLRYQDLSGEVQELEADGFIARVIQHEVDHLDGQFFVNRVSPVQRDMALRRYAKCQKGMRRA